MKMPAWMFASVVLLPGFLSAQEDGFTQAATLKDRRINESSGLALSHKHPGVFWTHNDSGGEPCLFAFDKTGVTVAKVRLPGAVNFDWEDIASRKDADGVSWLYVADIGDNMRMRPSVQVYQIPEPDLPADPAHEIESAEPRLWRGAYPDGRHDAESLLVHPLTGRIHIITRSEDGRSGVYAFPEKLLEDEAMTLEKIAALEFPLRARPGKRPRDAGMATAAAYSDDARRVIISTYSFFHEWTARPDEPLADVLKRQAEVLTPPVLRQTEGVCYDADRLSLWFTSEQLPTPLYFMKR